MTATEPRPAKARAKRPALPDLRAATEAARQAFLAIDSPLRCRVGPWNAGTAPRYAQVPLWAERLEAYRAAVDAETAEEARLAREAARAWEVRQVARLREMEQQARKLRKRGDR